MQPFLSHLDYFEIKVSNWEYFTCFKTKIFYIKILNNIVNLFVKAAHVKHIRSIFFLFLN